MDTIEKIAKWAIENRHNQLMPNGVFCDVLSNMIGDLIDENNAEHWEQNESNS